MSSHLRRPLALALLTFALTAATLRAETAAPPATKPRVDVVFVLDATGSMSGLIAGAKQKIWSIANAVIAQQPRPEVHLGLLAYRDRGDTYITKRFDLTDDIDAVYQNLGTFQAEGGGDEPESVNQALDEAVNKMSWSADPQATKIIFLVGDAPPHMDYKDDVKYPVTCQVAAKRGIIINTVQCGNVSSAREIWPEIARLAEGSYVALGQTGNMVTVATPMDADVAKLSAAIGATAVPYGSHVAQTEVLRKGSFATSAAATPAVAADRASYNMLSGGKAVQGRGDLVQDVTDGTVKLEALKEADLPPALQKLAPDERPAYLKQQQDQRTALNHQLQELVTKRNAYLADEQKKQAAAGKGDAFDLNVSATIKAQIERKK